MSILAQLAIALCVFIAGMGTGVKWQIGIVAARDLAAAEARETDSKQQRQFGDKAAMTHAANLARVNKTLGDAREEIAKLSGRNCLDAGTVGMLNAIGSEQPGSPASESAGTPSTAPTGTGIRFATERDVATAIATCRGRYAEVSDQLNRILDIEDRNFPPAP